MSKAAAIAAEFAQTSPVLNGSSYPVKAVLPPDGLANCCLVVCHVFALIAKSCAVAPRKYVKPDSSNLHL